MSEPYTPELGDLRETWVTTRATGDPDALPSGKRGEAEARAEFDRVLAQHDREVAARALRDAADAESVPVVVAATGIHGRAVMDVSLVLRAHRIESGEGA